MASKAFLFGVALILLSSRVGAQEHQERYLVQGDAVFAYHCEGSSSGAEFNVSTIVRIERYCWIGQGFALAFFKSGAKSKLLKTNSTRGSSVDCRTEDTDSCGMKDAARSLVAISAN